MPNQNGFTFKDILVPVIVSVIVGIGASWFATQTAVAAIEVKLEGVEDDINSIRNSIDVVSEIRFQQGQLIERLKAYDDDGKQRDRDMERIWERLNELESQIFTKADAGDLEQRVLSMIKYKTDMSS